MKAMANGTARQVAALLGLIVVTQIIYVVLSNSGAAINRPLIWSIEALAFMAMSVLALTALSRAEGSALGWAAIAVSGILNTVQVGMGLAMFGPLSEAGEALAPAYQAVVAGAFFLYFAGKLLFGLAAIAFGAALLRANGAARALGLVAIIAGMAAMGVNLAGMAMGMAMVFAAGAAGTAATLMLAIVLTMRPSLPR